MIISLSGAMQSGKSTIGRIIKELTSEDSIIFSSEWSHRSWALILKQGLEHDFPQEFSCSRWESNKEGYRNDIMPSLNITRREALQRLGDAKRSIHPDYFVRVLMARYKHKDADHSGFISTTTSLGYNLSFKPFPLWSNSGFPKWIITDTRYPNELKAVKDNGGVAINIVKPNITVNDSHSSETSLSSAEFDYTIINDGTLEELTEKVRKILVQEDIIS